MVLQYELHRYRRFCEATPSRTVEPTWFGSDRDHELRRRGMPGILPHFDIYGRDVDTSQPFDKTVPPGRVLKMEQEPSRRKTHQAQTSPRYASVELLRPTSGYR